MSILPGTADFTVCRGRTWKERILVKNPGSTTAKDLTGYGARMDVRKSISDDVPVISLSTDNGRISIESPATNGVILIEVSAEDTLDFPLNDFKVTDYVYDMEIYEEGSVPEYVEPLIEGVVRVRPEITRSA